MRLGLTNRFTRVSLGALIATVLMCVASVSIASAQVPPLPMFPFGPPGDFNAPAAPGNGAAPTSGAPPPALLSPPSTAAALKLIGSSVGWSRRTLSVKVSCEASGTVSVLRNGRRIGRRNFACPASGAVRVRVRITAAAARRIRVGTRVRVRVRTGAQLDTKRMRVVRASGKSGHASAHASVWSAVYAQNKYAGLWPTSGSWWEAVWSDEGFYGTHIAQWWDYYYWTVGGYWSYYGTWVRYAQDGTWYWWDPTYGAYYGPYQ